MLDGETTRHDIRCGTHSSRAIEFRFYIGLLRDFSYNLIMRAQMACMTADISVRYNVLHYVHKLRSRMSKLKPSRDIQPVTEFRANAAQFIEQVQATGEPLILTQHGRSAAVLLDVESYEGMLDELALLRDVRQAEQQVAAGTTVTHAAVAKKLRARLAR